MHNTPILPSYVQHQYMLVVPPSDKVLQRMKRIQSHWKDAFALYDGQMQRGHLLLARCHQYAMLEFKLCEYLRRVAMGATPFKVQLSHYFSYPTHTIGIRIANPFSVQHVIHALKQQPRLLKTPGHSTYFNTIPAIGLATRLQPAQFDAIWHIWQHRRFVAAFVANGMLLLRKPAGGIHWQVLEHMPFQNLPIGIRQGVLFA